MNIRHRDALVKRNNALLPKGFKRHDGSLLLGTLTIHVLSLALPVMTLQIYDRILPNQGGGTLFILLMGVCVAILLETILRLCRSYLIGRAGAVYEHRMACASLDKIIHADLSQMETRGVGEQLHRMGSITKLKDFYNGHALTVLLELVFVPLALTLIWYIAGFLVTIPLMILTFFMCISLYKGKKLRFALQQRELADDERFNFLIEALEGIHTLKSFSLEKMFERRHEALEEHSTYANYEVTQETADTFNSGAIFSHIMVASVISIGAWLVLNGMLTTGALIATLLLSGRIMQPIQKALVLWAKYQDFSLARHHVKTLFSTPQHLTLEKEKPNNIIRNGTLTLSNVSFHYLGSHSSILNSINFKLDHGEIILISGKHGCGKTTLLKLIAGIYPTTNGTINVDDENILSYNSADLTQHVGYVRSTSLIFRGTIRENITAFGQINEKQAREVAALLDVDSDVAKLPGGFDTLLNGNETDSIPPGLKQRISIVRSLATKPRLILFDNADRTLDKEGYIKIYHLLARLKHKVSMILVSDDYNIQTLADKHYVLENGSLHESNELNASSIIRPYQELRI